MCKGPEARREWRVWELKETQPGRSIVTRDSQAVAGQAETLLLCVDFKETGGWFQREVLRGVGGLALTCRSADGALCDWRAGGRGPAGAVRPPGGDGEHRAGLVGGEARACAVGRGRRLGGTSVEVSPGGAEGPRAPEEEGAPRGHDPGDGEALMQGQSGTQWLQGPSLWPFSRTPPPPRVEATSTGGEARDGARLPDHPRPGPPQSPTGLC